MRVVVFDGSEPASEEPRRIERNGIAIRTSTSAAAVAIRAGRACTTARPNGPSPATHRCSVSSPAASARRSAPAEDSRPEESRAAQAARVSAASTVKRTATLAATATPYRKLTPSANIPSSAMQTVIPANITARPEVSSESTIASSTDLPRCRPCRKRVTMKSA